MGTNDNTEQDLEANNQDDKERFDLLNQIESLKARIRQELALILEHPRTPKEFKDNPVVNKVVK
ncbi:MAG: hypothetical protein R3A13_01775 [Bdellovibrionota bacterium]